MYYDRAHVFNCIPLEGSESTLAAVGELAQQLSAKLQFFFINK